MFRALTILAAVAALAVSAAPASAGLLSSPLGVTTKPPPSTAQVTGGVDCVDCLMTSFAVRQHDAGMHAVKAPPKPPQSGASGFAKYIGRDGQFLGFKDGTSNTLLLREGVVDVIERDNGRSKKPPPTARYGPSSGSVGFKFKLDRPSSGSVGLFGSDYADSLF